MRAKLLAALLAVTVLWIGCSDDDSSSTESPSTGSIAGTLTFGTAAGSGIWAPSRLNLGENPTLSAMVTAAHNTPRGRLYTTRSQGGPRFVASEVLVRLSEAGLSPEAVLERVKLPGLSLTYRVNVLPKWHLVKATREGVPLSEEETLELLQSTRALPTVERAELNGIRHALALPSDNLYKYQWHYGQLQLPAAWDVSEGADSVTIAVVDTGILDHPELTPKVAKGYDFISDASRAGDGDERDANPHDEGKDEPQDESSWHGTHVAGTLGAVTNNTTGVAGVAWKCRILPVRVLGHGGGTDADIASGMAWAAGVSVAGAPSNPTPAQVVNLSLGGDGPPSSIYQDAIDEGVAEGAVYVMAAGNEGENTAQKSPANQQHVITVGAVGFTGSKASYSNFGNEVDVMAPGGEMAEDADADGFPDGVLSTYADQQGRMKYDYLQGTSMATPHVAGVVALMKAVNPSLDAAKIEQILKDTAVGAFKCTQGCGAGLVNAYAAVLKAKGVTPTGPAQLIVTTRDVPLGGGTKGLIGVANKGGGSLTVKATASGENASRLRFPQGPSKTLGPAQADVIPVEVDTSELANGAYTVKVDLDAGAAGSIPVVVNFRVGVALAGRETTVVAIYQDSQGEWQGSSEAVLPSAAQAQYTLEKVPPGRYYVLAGVDDNGNGKPFEDGERVGIYPNIDSPEEVTVEAGKITNGADFTLIATGAAPKEDSGAVPVGKACQSRADCGSGGECDSAQAGGYCFKYCPGGDGDCPSGSSCYGSGDQAVCLLNCSNGGAGQSTCRTDYVCLSTTTKPACITACHSNADCSAGETCDAKGYCN